jgi:hypothetical protein
MRSRRNLISSAFAVLFVLALFAAPYCFFNADYLRFKYQNAEYHARFGEACDLLLTQHPLGTKEGIMLSGTTTPLPAIISALHPVRIELSSNFVWIGVHEGHIGGLCIIWKPQWVPQDQAQTNTWNLSITSGEGPQEIVYVGNRQ